MSNVTPEPHTPVFVGYALATLASILGVPSFAVFAFLGAAWMTKAR